ncbi:hypothetical protein [Sphingomonas sp. VDB2]
MTGFVDGATILEAICIAPDIGRLWVKRTISVKVNMLGKSAVIG